MASNYNKISSKNHTIKLLLVGKIEEIFATLFAYFFLVVLNIFLAIENLGYIILKHNKQNSSIKLILLSEIEEAFAILFT